MKNKNKYYRTANLNLASFLFTQGLILVNIDRLSDPRRATFVFEETPELEEWVHEFSFAPENAEVVLIDPRKLFYSTRMLKDKLYQNTNY